MSEASTELDNQRAADEIEMHDVLGDEAYHFHAGELGQVLEQVHQIVQQEEA